MAVAIPVPTEAAEQKAFVRWLRANGYRHFRVPSETYTKSWKQKSQNTALGVVRGVPDMFVIVNDQFLGIEMKRQKGGVVAQEQKEWITALNDAGVPTTVARGADEAIAFVQAWAGRPPLPETEAF